MATEVINPGWYDQNEERQYPLADDATVTSTSGVRLPDALIVDLVLSAPVNVAPETIFLSEVKGFGAGLTLSFSVGSTVVAVATIPSSHARFDNYAVSAQNSSGISGRIVIGDPAALAELSVQDLVFDLAAGKLALPVVKPKLGGISSLSIKTSDGVTHALTGDVVLQAGTNFAVSIDGSGNVVLGAVGGVVYDDRYSCNTDSTGRVPVRSIAGAVPDGDGNISLVGSACLQISAQASTLFMQDTCAQPCCGCDELNATKDAEASLQGNIADTLAILKDLETRLGQLEQSFASTNIPPLS